MAITKRDRRTIFGLCKELGLDDDTRKDVQFTVTGKYSTTNMTPTDAAKLIAHLRKLRGPARPPRRAGRVPKTLKREPLLQKIEAQLSDMELPWEYAEGIAWRVSGGTGQRPGSQPGVKRMEWASNQHLQAVIAALHVEQKKRSWNTAIDRELARLGKDRDWLDNYLPPFMAGRWQRRLSLLSEVFNRLERL